MSTPELVLVISDPLPDALDLLFRASDFFFRLGQTLFENRLPLR